MKIKNNYEARMRIGKRIAELRMLRGISQRELARRTGIEAGNLNRIEAGRYSTGIDILDAIATELGTELDFKPLN